jgi:hypothetical protein
MQGKREAKLLLELLKEEFKTKAVVAYWFIASGLIACYLLTQHNLKPQKIWILDC